MIFCEGNFDLSFFVIDLLLHRGCSLSKACFAPKGAARSAGVQIDPAKQTIFSLP